MQGALRICKQIFGNSMDILWNFMLVSLWFRNPYLCKGLSQPLKAGFSTNSPLCEFRDLPNEAGTSPLDDYTCKFISCCLKLVARLRTKHRCGKGLVLHEQHCPSHRTCIQCFIHYLVQHKTLEQHKVLCGLSAPGHE